MWEEEVVEEWQESRGARPAYLHSLGLAGGDPPTGEWWSGVLAWWLCVAKWPALVSGALCTMVCPGAQCTVVWPGARGVLVWEPYTPLTTRSHQEQ